MPRKKKAEDKEEKETKKEKKEETEVSEKQEKDKKKSNEKKQEEEIVEEKEEKGEKVKEEKKEIKEHEEETLLVSLQEYIKVSIHIGTRAVTPTMREYVYRRKADGVAVLNTKKIDEKISQAANFLVNYAPGDIIICGKRDAVTRPLEAFSKATGIRMFKKYPAGIITNTVLSNFFEPKLLFILDPWVDGNALRDAVKTNVPIISLCSTNNNTHNIDFVVPCNNKTSESVGLVLYLIAKLYLEKRGLKDNLKKLKAEDFYFAEEKPREIKFELAPKEEKIDLTQAREFIKKKLEEKKAKETDEVIEEKKEEKKEKSDEKREK